MQKQEEDIEELLIEAGNYLETRTELWKLKTVDAVSELFSALVSRLVLIGLLTLFVVTVNTGLALLIGYWLGNGFYGFFIIGGVYGIAALVCYANRGHWIKGPVGNMIIRKILKPGFRTKLS
ncbi:MAG: hypothetical protein P4L51_03165 [Puia sp.]|nr:hypothetical protein [Puia sp.]